MPDETSYDYLVAVHVMDLSYISDILGFAIVR